MEDDIDETKDTLKVLRLTDENAFTLTVGREVTCTLQNLPVVHTLEFEHRPIHEHVPAPCIRCSGDIQDHIPKHQINM